MSLVYKPFHNFTHCRVMVLLLYRNFVNRNVVNQMQGQNINPCRVREDLRLSIVDSIVRVLGLTDGLRIL